MSQLKKRLEALEQRVQVAPEQPMKVIGTALAVTTSEPYTTTDNNIVTFHSHTLKAAYAMREAWLAEQKNTIILTSPSHLAISRLMCFEYQEEYGRPMPPAQQQEALNRMREKDWAIELDRLEGETPAQHALRRFAEANS